MRTTEQEEARALLSAAAVRERCSMIFAAARAGRLAHFTIDEGRLAAAADLVADTVRGNYPSLKVPFHSRWRHFAVDGRDLWAQIAVGLPSDSDPLEVARVRFDLAITSVLLDAGAGPDWRWIDPATRRVFSRSEGLALASLHLFASGQLSSFPDRPLRVDARGLRALTVSELAAAFQTGPANPLLGLESRVALLNRLGERIAAAPDLFGTDGRIGGLVDVLVAEAGGSAIPAPAILELVLAALGPIWPGRIELGGINLGDTWRHPAIAVPGATNGLVPFHKLSQWLTYSLIEPLQDAGREVSAIEGLTGLAEYRNGGLFLDMGVIVPRVPSMLGIEHQPQDEAIVEWRALTVALLDEIAPLVRARLGLSPSELPLAAVLEGGTWAAGRRIASRLRPGGPPPLRILTDGTVF